MSRASQGKTLFFLYLFRRGQGLSADQAPFMQDLLQREEAAKDFSTAPSRALADELERLNKPHLMKIYPPVGQTAEDGRNVLYQAVP